MPNTIFCSCSIAHFATATGIVCFHLYEKLWCFREMHSYSTNEHYSNQNNFCRYLKLYLSWKWERWTESAAAIKVKIESERAFINSIKKIHRTCSIEIAFYYKNTARCQASNSVIWPKVSFPAFLDYYPYSRKTAQAHQAPCCQGAGR